MSKTLNPEAQADQIKTNMESFVERYGSLAVDVVEKVASQEAMEYAAELGCDMVVKNDAGTYYDIKNSRNELVGSFSPAIFVLGRVYRGADGKVLFSDKTTCIRAESLKADFR